MGKKEFRYKSRKRTTDSIEGKMPSVRKDDVVLIAVSDLHLCHTPPIFRSKEENWYETMAGYIQQLTDIKNEYNCPIVCAGDIFDKWNPYVELVNFAIENLPDMLAIPGQHDLPYHSYKDMKRSGYHNLILAGTINNIVPGKILSIEDMEIHGFPWGFEIKPPEKINSLIQYISVAHSYIWTKKTCYPNAPEEKKVGSYEEKLKGFDVAIFGDNHKGFVKKSGDCNIVNCGGFMIRKSDEIDYKPCVSLIKSTGEVERIELNTSKDKYCDIKEVKEAEVCMDFVSNLLSLGDCDISFSDLVIKSIQDNKVPDEVKNIILKAMKKE